MKINYYYTIAFRKSIVLILLALAISFTSNAQSNITDYVLFGGFGTCPTGANAPLAPGCAVQLGSNNTITGTGAIGSYTLIQSTGNASTGGSLYSNGKINLSNNNTITGRVVAANKNNVSGTIFQATSGVNIGGNVDVNGNIVLAGGSIGGKVHSRLVLTQDQHLLLDIFLMQQLVLQHCLPCLLLKQSILVQLLQIIPTINQSAPVLIAILLFQVIKR
jgi:hypothetical protein